MPTTLAEPDRIVADLPRDESRALDKIIQEVTAASVAWADELRVTIGRAAAISGLRESQIRYFEELGALQPATTTGKAGASRLYSLSDLRRLRVLARLSPEYKAAEAADLVRQHAEAIDHEPPIALEAALAQERSAVADGFFLARIISQIIAAIEAEIAQRLNVDGTVPPETRPQVRGLIYRGTQIFERDPPTPDAISSCAAELCARPADALIALCQPGNTGEQERAGWAPELLRATGSDAQTILFYSPEPRPISDLADAHFTAYIPPGRPEHTLLIALSSCQLGPLLCPESLADGRAFVLDRLLELAHAIFADFRRVTHGRGYRYRSDGFPLDLTRSSYGAMLALIAELIFPGDSKRMAALLVPDGLDQPQGLSILAHHRYAADLLARAKISLHGNGQGLCGRAYVSREPFLSLNVDGDSEKVRYGPEEGSQVALAVPLASTWGISPFGVLYLASGNPQQTLSSPAIYCALVLGDILSELLGRWWLTRLRHAQDIRLHRQLPEMLSWLDSLDAHGPGFTRGVDAVLAQWAQVKDERNSLKLDQVIALAVLDINHYRETIQARSNDPFPLYAQQHVTAAIRRVLRQGSAHCSWFGNDHALLVLDGDEAAQADRLVQRIIDQVADSPVSVPGRRGGLDTIAICAAVKVMTYRSLNDLACEDGQHLRRQIGSMIDLLRRRAGQLEAAPAAPSGSPDMRRQLVVLA